MVRAECDVAPVFSTCRKSAAEQKQCRVRKVATLAESGERGRALAAARNAPPVPVTQQICARDQKPLSCRSEPCCRCTDPHVEPLLVPSCRADSKHTLRRMPRLSEPGPLGMRAEHWYDFGEQAGDSNLFVQIVAHIAAAAVPHSVLPYLRAHPSQTHRGSPTTSHDVLLSSQTCPRVSHGSQEGIGLVLFNTVWDALMVPTP